MKASQNQLLARAGHQSRARLKKERRRRGERTEGEGGNFVGWLAGWRWAEEREREGERVGEMRESVATVR